MPDPLPQSSDDDKLCGADTDEGDIPGAVIDSRRGGDSGDCAVGDVDTVEAAFGGHAEDVEELGAILRVAEEADRDKLALSR